MCIGSIFRLKSKLQHRIEKILSFSILLLAVVVLLAPRNQGFLDDIYIYAPQLMIGLLVLSFVFLVLDQKSLMIVGLLATASIAFHLKNASNENYVISKDNDLPETKVLMVKLSQLADTPDTINTIISESTPDIITFQDYNAFWERKLHTSLITHYPYTHNIKIDSVHGVAVFSNRKIFKIDNFYYKKLPNLNIELDNYNSKLTMIASFIPDKYTSDNKSFNDHMQLLIKEINKSRNPVLVLSDFNKMYWSKEMLNFKKASSLNNSRRSVSINNMNPEDHIFFSDQLECSAFNEIRLGDKGIVGLSAAYQVK